MHADLDLLCIAVYCTADDLLPEPSNNRRRQLTDAEVVTLAVAQVAMGVPSDRRFLRAARRQLGHLFKALPSQSAFHKRRVRLRETIEWLSSVFANSSPGSRDNMLLLDSAPGRVRQKHRHQPPQPTRGRLRLRVLRRSLSPVLGHAPPRPVHARWHPRAVQQPTGPNGTSRCS